MYGFQNQLNNLSRKEGKEVHGVMGRFQNTWTYMRRKSLKEAIFSPELLFD